MTPATPKGNKVAVDTGKAVSPRDVTEDWKNYAGWWSYNKGKLPDGHRVLILPPGFVVVRDEPVRWAISCGGQHIRTTDLAPPEGAYTPERGYTVTPLYAPEDPT